MSKFNDKGFKHGEVVAFVVIFIIGLCITFVIPVLTVFALVKWLMT